MVDDTNESKAHIFLSFGIKGQPPETPEMQEKKFEAMKQYLETGTISPELPDLLVEERDGVFLSVKETAQDRIAALSGTLAGILETIPDNTVPNQVTAAKLRLVIKLLNDLPRLIEREKKRSGV